jgi:hypothetical protein
MLEKTAHVLLVQIWTNIACNVQDKNNVKNASKLSRI